MIFVTQNSGISTKCSQKYTNDIIVAKRVSCGLLVEALCHPLVVNWSGYMYIIISQCTQPLCAGCMWDDLEWGDHNEIVHLSLHLSLSLSLSHTLSLTHTHTHTLSLSLSLSLPSAFCAFYCYDGVLRERPFEVLAYVIGVLVIIVYTIGNFAFQFHRSVVNGGDNVTMTNDFKLKIVS